MTELIQKLWAQTVREYGHAGQEACAQQFAEAIVKECAYIVENSPWQLRRGYKAIDQANLVKQHFGVKV